MVGNDFRGSRMPPKPFTDIIAGLWKPKSAGHNLVQVLPSTQFLLKNPGVGPVQQNGWEDAKIAQTFDFLLQKVPNGLPLGPCQCSNFNSDF